jgi:hypothetical protein
MDVIADLTDSSSSIAEAGGLARVITLAESLRRLREFGGVEPRMLERLLERGRGTGMLVVVVTSDRADVSETKAEGTDALGIAMGNAVVRCSEICLSDGGLPKREDDSEDGLAVLVSRLLDGEQAIEEELEPSCL